MSGCIYKRKLGCPAAGYHSVFASRCNQSKTPCLTSRINKQEIKKARGSRNGQKGTIQRQRKMRSVESKPSAIHRRLTGNLGTVFHSLREEVGLGCLDGYSPATPTTIRRMEITAEPATRDSCRLLTSHVLFLVVTICNPRLWLTVASRSRSPVLFSAHLFNHVLIDFFLTRSFAVTFGTPASVDPFLVHLLDDKCVDLILSKRPRSALYPWRCTIPTHRINRALMISRQRRRRWLNR